MKEAMKSHEEPSERLSSPWLSQHLSEEVVSFCWVRIVSESRLRLGYRVYVSSE